MRRFALFLLLAAVSCGPDKDPELAPGRPAPVEPYDPDARDGVSQRAGQDGAPKPSSKDGPEISRSAGREGGVVVFWPRVIPKTEDAAMKTLAGKLQEELVALARGKFDHVDVRPEPERVCPRAGCKGSTFGVLLTHGGGGCTALALVSKPGTAPMQIVPWGGIVKLKRDSIPFREHPESEVTIQDAVPCDKLIDSLKERRPEIEKALEAVR
jgi:hypothetical protein